MNKQDTIIKHLLENPDLSYSIGTGPNSCRRTRDCVRNLCTLGYLRMVGTDGYHTENYLATAKFFEWAKSTDKLSLTQFEAKRGFGLKNCPIRFFLGVAFEDEDDPAYPYAIKEVSEAEFIAADGDITYERNTLFSNGVNQVCLTKGREDF